MYVRTQQVRPGPEPEKVVLRTRIVIISMPLALLGILCGMLGILCIALAVAG